MHFNPDLATAKDLKRAYGELDILFQLWDRNASHEDIINHLAAVRHYWANNIEPKE